MFYTKYRPQKFSEISKPNDAAESLMKQVRAGKVGHAYLFVGSRGTGKTTTARILAKALNCKKLESDGDPCDKCDNCVAIKSGSFIDLIEIDAASNRGIDDIRELRDKIRLSPSVGKRKVYIIDEVHMLTNEAFNALLKTLEEPPSHVNFILCTTELHKIPETIKSRCQVLKFKRATVNQLIDRLSFIAKEEKAKVPKEDLKKIAQASLGGFRDAETLLQQVVEGSISADNLLDIGSPEAYADFVDLLREQDAKEALRVINKVYEDGVDLYIWVGELIKYLRDILFIKAGADENMFDETGEIYERMREQAKDLNSTQITRILSSLMEAQTNIKGSFITQLPVELSIVNICGDGKDSPDMTKVNRAKSANRADERPAKHEKPAAKTVKAAADESKKGNESVVNTADDGEENEETTEIVEEPAINLENIVEKWPEIIKRTKEYNHSIQALLKSSTPSAVEGKNLILEVMYAFHKERLESQKNRKIVEDVISEVYEVPLRIKCKVMESRPKKGDKEVGNLTDLNVVAPKVSPENALDLFDGGLPLV